MDHRKRALILDGANDLYCLIQDLLDLPAEDPRHDELARATERYLDAVMTLATPIERPMHVIRKVG